jgi:cysteinyl-tRNA synthetase
VSIRLYDTATREVRDFVPVRDGSVGIYHCGLTVQAPPHVGHIRKEVVFDVLRRWLMHRGYDVTLVANVTDIDDKILTKSAEQGLEWWALAYANERRLHWAYDVLGCLPPTYEPRATGHIPEMLELIGTLIDKEHAYVAGDDSGDVYFDVRSWPSYGELSNQRIDDMEAATDADPRGKRDPRDFALWKGHKAGEPETASWPAPWGRGRPGWHLECSAMVGKYLGAEFDIHGGGLDLRFPHHENEQAQSRAAGRAFARTWMHNAMVERIEGYVVRATETSGGAADPAAEVPEEFARAMDEDLGVPAALAALQGAIREGNKNLGDAGTLASVRAMLGVLGLDPLAAQWSAGSDDAALRAALDTLVGSLVASRQEARAARDFATADTIRDQLAAAGVEVEDTASGARWTVSGT